MQSRCRADGDIWFEDVVVEAEKVADKKKGDLKTLYNSERTLWEINTEDTHQWYRWKTVEVIRGTVK